MIQQAQEWLSGIKEPVDIITSPPFLPAFREPMDVLMRQHGGWIDMSGSEYSLHFPVGTIKEEVFPRVLSSRYRITFPDGFQISEWVNWKGVSLVRIPLDAFPLEVQQNYQAQ